MSLSQQGRIHNNISNDRAKIRKSSNLRWFGERNIFGLLFRVHRLGIIMVWNLLRIMIQRQMLDTVCGGLVTCVWA